MSGTRNGQRLGFGDTWIPYAWERWFGAYYRGGEVLDCGCGTGGNGAILLALGVRSVLGIDLDRGCLTESRLRGVTVVQSDLSNSIPLRPGTADMVFLIHVLEHIDRGDRLLSSVAATLKPGGAAVVVTPDWSKQGLAQFYDDPTHRRPYTRKSLEAVLRGAGLRVRVLLRHNVGYRLGWTPLWRVFPRLCFTGDALFAVAERDARDH